MSQGSSRNQQNLCSQQICDPKENCSEADQAAKSEKDKKKSNKKEKMQSVSGAEICQ